ncbi:MAG: hypothetical protein VXW65_01375 [Pseudomonadota bacterium]|nr:hypothetical protein [Pseudomonadota bacterium]
MKRQDLFPDLKPPRAKPRVMAHAEDHGEFPDGRPSHRFVCKKCSFDQWLAGTVTEGRRGIPCPTCNTEQQ